MKKQNRYQISTSRLLSRIKAADSPESATAYHAANGEPSLQEVLYALMEKNGFQPKDIIRESGIDRSYFYHIYSGVKKPARNMALRIGFCARADLDEMNRLLRLTDAPGLYPKVRRDALLIYAIQNHYSMAEVNALLQREGEQPLYREENHE